MDDNDILLGREVQDMLWVSATVVYRLRTQMVLKVRYHGGHFSRNEVEAYRAIRAFKETIDGHWNELTIDERRSLDVRLFIERALEEFERSSYGEAVEGAEISWPMRAHE